MIGFQRAFPTTECGGRNALDYKFSSLSFFSGFLFHFQEKKRRNIKTKKNEPMQTTAGPLNQGVAPANHTIQKEHLKRNEQSLDYILRSGAAGGIAGCVVCVYKTLL